MPHIWETRDGRKIPVTEMTDPHLDNTIAMLERKGFTTTDICDFITPSPRGEMAQMAWEHEMMDSAMYSPALAAMHEERKARRCLLRKGSIFCDLEDCPCDGYIEDLGLGF